MNRSKVPTLTLVAALAFAGPLLAKHTITVTAGKTPLVQAPVTVVLPKELVGKAIQLAEAKSGDSVAVQADSAAGKPAITWIVATLAAGESKNYTIEIGEPSESSEGQGVQLKQTEKGLDIFIDGELFTTYLTNAGPKPYCWPIIGPTGKPVTRAYPMRDDNPLEPKDHHHHRSFWFTHGKVNGENFWSEEKDSAKTTHTEFLNITSGPVFGEFTTRVDWTGNKGNKVCQDVRRMRVYRVPDARLFDFEIAIKATEGPVVFGDDKEGTFGFRVASSMDVESKLIKEGSRGTLLNSNGDKNGAAWGKRAKWCDYVGPVDGETVGIAIFDNPKNLRHPTYWHARTYGLFTANPFGLSHFTSDKNNDGTHTVPKGGELRLNYRIYIHKGDTAAAKVGDVYAEYAEPPKVTIQ